MNGMRVAMRGAELISAGLLLVACSATMVHPPGGASGSPYAPINERSRGGMVKYLNAGADTVINARREDAYKQMHDACRGRYQIDAEGPREEGGVVAPIGKGALFGSFQYWYIQFSCVD